MQTMQYVIYLLFANAALHVISLAILQAKQGGNRSGTFLFAVINGVLGFALFRSMSWALWPALILPAIGFLGLSITYASSGGSKLVNLLILAVDAAIVGLMVKYMFF